MQNRIEGFDGLRALAVAMVLLNHKTVIGNRYLTGGYGVRLFFVLSGFLIIGILYGRREQLEKGATTLRSELFHFYENRLFRIWPIYYLTILIALTAGAIGFWKPLTQSELLGTLTFTSNIFQAYVWSDYPHHIGPLWSVAVEEQFYLWAGLGFLICPREYYTRVCVGVVGIAVLAGLLQGPLHLPLRSSYVGPLTNFGLMALGGYASINGARYRKLAVAVTPYLLLLYVALPVLVMKAGHDGGLGQTLGWSVGPLVAIVLIGVRDGQSSKLTRFLSIYPIKYVGRISYGVYLYQSLIDLSDFGLSFRGLWLANIALVILVASGSWHLVEKPLLRLRDLRRLSAREAITLSYANTTR